MSGVLACIAVALLCGLLLACWKASEARAEADMYRELLGATQGDLWMADRVLESAEAELSAAYASLTMALDEGISA